ncbi:hypothetical protein [Poseidonibacter ostreae]|uniref:Uncharacterized protein n=1 Tax=Poseidonibacter ostreae TaxID=2654171 RepID=A0A6L4WTZ4_9BACT|nr:hypothetical protein [Poseidonibacter ostreae]KAB7889574.1 hypothetical protein GBG19_05825 [Poseidonibacter ostreae]
MSTMSYGFHYDRGQKVGYDISFGSVRLSFVSSKDKARIIKEIKSSGYSKDEITIERRED